MATRRKSRPRPPNAPPDPQFDTRIDRSAELARRAALALAAMLLVARACWPGEGSDELSSGQGIAWVLIAIGAVGVGLASIAIRGRGEFRAHWCDAAVVALVMLVGWSAWHAADRRVALNLAWQWIGVGLVYLLVRFLPRDAAERRAVFVVLIATAAALACFGLYQVLRLYPEARALYRKDPAAAMRLAGVADEPGLRAAFEQRLLGSQEPISTFSLANSLAGFLLGPVVIVFGVGIDNLSRIRESLYTWLLMRLAGIAGIVIAANLVAARARSIHLGDYLAVGLGGLAVALSITTIAATRKSLPWGKLIACATLGLVLLVCLLLTKSRTAYAGLLLGCCVLVWRKRSLLPMRAWAMIGLLGIGAIATLVGLGLATRQLDGLVLLESFKSLRYRWEYWVGTMRVLFDSLTWLRGLGPGNFAGPYLIHKLPEASEGIKDPHNALLEVCSTAGVFALIAFVLAIGFGLRSLFARRAEKPEAPSSSPHDARWLVTGAGTGGFILAMILRPDLSPFAFSANPFEGDLERWVILGVAWAVGAWLARVVSRIDIDLVSASAAAVCAIVLNLMGAGGIGFAPVALMLWTTLALGVDATSGGATRLVGRGAAIVGLMLLAALLGTFVGTVGPAWAAELAIGRGEQLQNLARAEAQDAAKARESGLARRDRSASLLEAAGVWFQYAGKVDRYAGRPWTLWAAADLELWRAKGASPYEMIWHRVRSELKQARTIPRDPNAFAIAATEYQVATQLLATASWPEAERKTLLRDRLAIAQRAARLNPTSAQVLANLSVAAEERGDPQQALEAAERALQLDAETPHPDRKLAPAERKRLRRRVEEWGRKIRPRP